MAETTALVPSALYAPMQDHGDNHLASGKSSGRLWRVGNTVWSDIPEVETGSWYGPNGTLVNCRLVGSLLDIYV